MKATPPIVLNPEGRFPGLITVDHAGRSIPSGLGSLGLGAGWLDTHFSHDIGAEGLARAIAARLDVPVVMCDISRLVIDVNRWTADPESIVTRLDGTPVPGNTGLDTAARAARAEAVFWPYHEAIGRIWARQCARHARPFFFALHSCTRVFAGARRPWDCGTIWHDDRGLSQGLLQALGRHSALALGDNQPYSGLDGLYTVDRHTYGSGLPACGFEVTNDGLTTPGGRQLWADYLSEALLQFAQMDTAA